MKGLPHTVDLAPLLGATVIQVCFGENECQIYCDNRVQIVVEGQIITEDLAGKQQTIERYADEASLLCRLLGKRVTAATRTKEGGLDVKFDDGTQMRILNSNEQFESLQLHVNGRVYVA
jgi:hypothetical protein